MRIVFYDTCRLLNEGEKIFNEDAPIYLSNITFQELEHIKTSATKDGDTKYKARRLLHCLANNREKYTVISYSTSDDELRKKLPILLDNNDSRIIFSAYLVNLNRLHEVTFKTADLNCAVLAESIGLNVEYDDGDFTDYKGYTEIKCNSDEELSNLYTNLYSKESNQIELYENEYLFIKNKEDNVVDIYRYTEGAYEQVSPHIAFESEMFGKVTAKDKYQLAAMDSMKRNQLTIVRGPAGAGKSYLAMSYLFSQLEKNKIDRIIIFCNTVATRGAARLGFYPGTKDEKLLDSQIGSFLVSKLGSIMAVEDMIEKGTLLLLPMSDIRGFDTSGVKSGVYITEAQNTSIDLMQLALQRIGEDSICILDGDTEAQVDLGEYSGRNNGLRRVSEVFRGQNFYGEITLNKIRRSKIAEIAQKM